MQLQQRILQLIFTNFLKWPVGKPLPAVIALIAIQINYGPFGFALIRSLTEGEIP
jgi:hypothetical protein